jgi:hypothetical protein
LVEPSLNAAGPRHALARGSSQSPPRCDKGEAGAQPLPGAPGTATFHAGTLTLSVPAMPEHATSLRAYRKPAGGVVVLADTSTGTTVSGVGLGPLTPGVTCELWVTGHNSQDDGPESNHVSHTAVQARIPLTL